MTDHEYEVVVAGGGPAGVASAVAAARMGENVALIEREDILGGAGTTNLVNNFINAYWDGERFIIGGLFMEIRHRLIGRKALYKTRGPDQRGKHGQEPFDPGEYAAELEILCRESGVDLFMNSVVTTSDASDDRIRSIELLDGTVISGDTFVDATGDAVLAYNSGVPTRLGSGENEWTQPLTYMYIVGPVDLNALEEHIPEAVMYDRNTDDRWADLSHLEESNRIVRAASEEGDLSLPISEITTLRSVPGRPKQFAGNLNYIQVDDPTDESELEAATREGKRQMEEGVRFLREWFPGFNDIDVVSEPQRIGVRESRRIEGRYELTEEDVATCRQFDDVIAQSCFPIDIHRAEGDWEWDEEFFEDGEHYDIPWRSLVPHEGPENIVIAGRSISADQVAFSSLRVSSSVIAIGEAAGVTAAIAASEGSRIADVDPNNVQKSLRDARAILE